jgi:transposase
MDIALNRLPDDPDALRAIIARQAGVAAKREAELARVKADLVAHEALIAALRLSLERLKRQKYGRSSEKIEREIAQLELALEDLGVTVAADAAPDTDEAADAEPVSPANARAQAKSARAKLTGTLERERIVLDPGSSCPDCGGPLRLVGEDVAEMLEFIAAKIKVVETARIKKSCRHCEAMVQLPAPNRPIPRAMAGPGLLAHILVSKFDDHLPLYRQGEILARHGAEIPRSTLIDWCGQAIRALRPLSEVLKRGVLSASRLHGDDTPVPVLDPTRRRKTTKQGRLWVYVRDDRPHGGADPPACAYFYSPNRKGEHPRAHLKDFKGVLQADAYAGFKELYAPDPITGVVRVREAACWAHVRRKIHDVFKATQSAEAKQALAFIGELYDVERAINGQPAETRLTARQKESIPRMAALKTWMEDRLDRMTGKSNLAGAFRYALKRWTALSLFLKDGTVAIDNNAAERAMRPVAMGRKNFLFAGSDGAGENMADILSLIETAKLNNLNPQTYLADVLDRIADHKIKRIDELLPWNWQPTSAT